MEITPQELKSKMDQGEKITLIDVREPEEYALCFLKGAKLISLNELPERFAELNSNDFTVLYCHLGGRSLQAALWLKQNGFQNVWSLKGGIDAWAQTIEPAMERY